jgi:uncharacterized alpha-E superfamily protein
MGLGGLTMLGRTAASLFWMSRYIERAENIARLTEVGSRVALTPDIGTGHREDWKSILIAAGAYDAYLKRYQSVKPDKVIHFLLFDRENSSSVASCLETARNNARAVRTALTREMWEALNSTYINFNAVKPSDLGSGKLPEFLDWVRQRSALFRGSLLGTLLRDQGYHFSQLGAFIERADNTARILDVKYYVLLPSNEAVGGELDAFQWETILRSVSAHRSYRHVYQDRYRPWNVAEFLILRPEMPRSLRFCYSWVDRSLEGLGEILNLSAPSVDEARSILDDLKQGTMDAIFQSGLHEFLTEFLRRNNSVSNLIADDFHFL